MVAAIVVVIVIIVCLKHLKFKKRACQQDKELELKNKMEDNVDADRRACREQERIKEQRREMNRQWSRQQMEKLLEDIRNMRESAENDTEMFRQYMVLVKEISDKLFSSVAMDSDATTDSEEERNKEMEREQKEQLLNLLRHILKGGRRNKSLKGEMLRTIVDEVGNDVNDYVGQKLQSTCL